METSAAVTKAEVRTASLIYSPREKYCSYLIIVRVNALRTAIKAIYYEVKQAFKPIFGYNSVINNIDYKSGNNGVNFYRQTEKVQREFQISMFHIFCTNIRNKRKFYRQ